MNEVQKRILMIMYEWIKTNRTPITLKDIVVRIPDVKARTVRASAEALCTKGYFRRGVNIKNNSCYISIRTESHYEE